VIPASGAVRAARARDLDRLAGLFTLGLEHHVGVERFRLRRDAEDRARTWLADWLAMREAPLLVFESRADGEDAGQLLGLCTARLLTRPAIFEETVRGEIEHLVVRPEARRRGIGRVLAGAALEALRGRGATRVEIQVARDNAEGQAFWRALGFAPVMDVLERAL